MNKEEITIYDSEYLMTEIMNPDTHHNTTKFREMIFKAEDTGFSLENSKKFSSWLLNFAIQQRDSTDSKDKMVVWSAIRTGASMLTPNKVYKLKKLIETGYPIETSLVTINSFKDSVNNSLFI